MPAADLAYLVPAEDVEGEMKKHESFRAYFIDYAEWALENRVTACIMPHHQSSRQIALEVQLDNGFHATRAFVYSCTRNLDLSRITETGPKIYTSSFCRGSTSSCIRLFFPGGHWAGHWVGCIVQATWLRATVNEKFEDLAKWANKPHWTKWLTVHNARKTEGNHGASHFASFFKVKKGRRGSIAFHNGRAQSILHCS